MSEQQYISVVQNMRLPVSSSCVRLRAADCSLITLARQYTQAWWCICQG